MKKKEIMPFATTSVNLKGIMLSEVSQTKKDKHCLISLLKAKQKNSSVVITRG